YFSVASLYAFGHSTRFDSTTVMGKPRFTHHSMPGDSRSFALATLLALILSPGATSASALRPAMPAVASTTSASPTILRIGQSPPFPRHAKSLMAFPHQPPTNRSYTALPLKSNGVREAIRPSAVCAGTAPRGRAL